MGWKDKFPKENRYFETENGVLYNDDVLKILSKFPDGSVNCVVTSPPYWLKRDYEIDGQIGLESTFQEYLEKLWKVFDEIYRILTKDGTIWVNLGDTYFGSGKDVGTDLTKSKQIWIFDKKEKKICKHCGKEFYGWKFQQFCSNKCADVYNTSQTKKYKTQKKSLCLIPERFIIGMIERGWILRNEIIWYKPDSLPEPVEDRFTVNFEKIFFFVKSGKYYFKQQFEIAKYDGRNKNEKSVVKYKNLKNKLNLNQSFYSKKSKRWVYNDSNGNYLRNMRCIWKFPTANFKNYHFAVFPEEIPYRCIDAGCPDNGIVLDVFIGSGTTAVVSEKLNRKWIGIELNPNYCEIAKNRINEFIKNKKPRIELIKQLL